MKKKYFLISIDTEGDDQWEWLPGKPITTENVLYLPRFQSLCEKYGFKPTYLTNYEMANDRRFVDYFKPKALHNECEIGMHLHAWNCPPDHELSNVSIAEAGHCPYLIEYPNEVMDQKICTMTKLLSDKFETSVITHRAGRWAMNGRYFSLLENYGYRVDCSFTPGVDWGSCTGMTEGSRGSDYTNIPERAHMIGDILEIPMTVRHYHMMAQKRTGTMRELAGRLHGYVKTKHELWLRPNGRNLNDMLYLVNRCEKAGDPYIMFMIHSSELMPGGCWRFDTEEKIEKLYQDIDALFSRIAESYTGVTIGDYGNQVVKKHNA